jgi:hypothetical protein
MLNDLGQTRGMQLVLTKANASIRPMLEGIARGLAEHGHAPTQLVWSDSASGMMITYRDRNAADVQVRPAQ